MCERCVGIDDLETFDITVEDFCLVKANMPKLEEVLSSGCHNAGYYVDLDDAWQFKYLGAQKNGRRWIYIDADGFYENPAEYEELFYASFITRCRTHAGRSQFGVFFDLDSQEFVDLQFHCCW